MLPDSRDRTRQMPGVEGLFRSPEYLNGCGARTQSTTSREPHLKYLEACMVTFICETCGRVKKPEQQWILGSAAESLGAVSARREVNILSAWSDAQAVHPLAVHFCSERCKDKYLNKLFSYGSAA